MKPAILSYQPAYRLFSLVLSLVFLSQTYAQQNDNDELDVWKGCSLGIRLEFEDSMPIISDVYPHVVDSSPFQKGDKLTQIGELKFPESTIDDLVDLLNGTQPESNLAARVIRDSDEINLNVATFRKELVDIHAIHRRLSRNRIIEKHLKDTDRESLLDDMVDRMVAAVKKSQSPRLASEALNRIIDEIDVSHTAIIPASAGLSFSANTKGALGFVLQRHVINGRNAYFVIDRKPGTESYNSSILVGDEILSVNGVEIEKSKRLDLSGHEDRHQLFAVDAKLDEEVKIEYLRTPFDDSETATIKAIQDPKTVDSVRASSQKLQMKDIEMGYLRFWNLMSMDVNTELSKKLKEDFVDCDAIILDLRGRGGIVPAVLALDRTVKKSSKPVVVTIDGLTRSAKEMLTYLLKKHEHVLVVGTKTAGAVTGATMTKLPSGNSLMFPVASADSLKQYIDGAIIEGVGVEPDERVEHFVPYSAGTDRILNHAMKRAAEIVIQRKATSQLESNR